MAKESQLWSQYAISYDWKRAVRAGSIRPVRPQELGECKLTNVLLAQQIWHNNTSI